MRQHAEIAALRAEIAALWAVVADLREQRASKPRPVTDQDHKLLAQIVAAVSDGEPFKCGEFGERKTAKRWGEALAALLPFSPVDDFAIERRDGGGRRAAWWVVRYVGGGRT